jgi:EAL domain-containing protein (putative c-di-GMP-specific phosphodiesterase class I)
LTKPIVDFDEAARDAALCDDPISNLSLMSEMIDGIHRGQLMLHYQPKHDFRAACISSVEALVRWTHPTRGRVEPDLFVTIAEQTGHIGALTEWSLIRAIGDQMRMTEAGHDLRVSVNLSGRLVGDDAFTEMAIGLVQNAGARLCLEITETAAMNDPEAARANIARYSKAGILIAIDDYGAGLASLSYLHDIRAQELKLDKSFLQTLGAGQCDVVRIKSTIDLAHGLGMKVTAEGVESEAMMTLLVGMGCDAAQGYFIGKAAPVEDLIELLERRGANA